GTDTQVSVYPTQRPIISTVAGKVYEAAGWVRSDTPGRSICLRIREYTAAGVTFAQNQTCVTATAQWQRFGPLSYTVQQSGGQLSAFVIENPAGPGDTFETDGLELTDG